MNVAYFKVPEDVHLPEPLDAKPGDWIILRPSHPTRPLIVQRHVGHHDMAAMLDYMDAVELVEHSAAAKAAIDELHDAVRPRLKLV